MVGVDSGWPSWYDGGARENSGGRVIVGGR